MLDTKTRYLQVAFNYDLGMAMRILPGIRYDPRIWIEAGTPFIKREGMSGIRGIRKLWRGTIVADVKTMDGAIGEVDMAKEAGADAITILGASPRESRDLFVKRCEELKMLSMVDMIGVDDPLDVLMHMKKPPDVVVLHLGRDEEGTRGKVIEYRHVNRIRSKYDVSISAAGGVTLKEARSAIFNGANIVVANIVRPEDKWQGISTKGEVGEITKQFLETIE